MAAGFWLLDGKALLISRDPSLHIFGTLVSIAANTWPNTADDVWNAMVRC